MWRLLPFVTLVLFSGTSGALAQEAPAQQPPASPGNDTAQSRPQRDPDQQPLAPDRRSGRGGNREGDLRVPENVQVVRDVVYAEAPITSDEKGGKSIQLKMDVVFKKDSGGEPMPVIVYIHGGGWSAGTREMGLRPSIALALGGYVACTIDYRLSGDAKFPAAVHDCKAAIRFLRANAEELGIDPNRIGVWGHSAGGHLSALLGTTSNTKTLDGEIGAAPKATSSAVQCVVDISGPIDLTTVEEGVRASGPVALFIGGPVRTHMDEARKASPNTYVDSKDPPTLIIHGTDDRVVDIHHSEILEKALKDASVDVEFVKAEGNGHIVTDPDAYRRAAEWFDSHLGGKAAGAVQELMEQIGQNLRNGGQEGQPRRTSQTQRPRAGSQSTQPTSPSPVAPSEE